MFFIYNNTVWHLSCFLMYFYFRLQYFSLCHVPFTLLLRIPSELSVPVLAAIALYAREAGLE